MGWGEETKMGAADMKQDKTQALNCMTNCDGHGSECLRKYP